jgi:hypothetical protein
MLRGIAPVDERGGKSLGKDEGRPEKWATMTTTTGN